MKNKRITKKNKLIMAEWISKHGACKFDIKNEDVILHDGGLFSIENEKILLPKITGFRKLPNKNSQILFSKKKYLSDNFYARLWMCEIDNTIKYLKSMKKMLNNIGISTNLKKK